MPLALGYVAALKMLVMTIYMHRATSLMKGNALQAHQIKASRSVHGNTWVTSTDDTCRMVALLGSGLPILSIAVLWPAELKLHWRTPYNDQRGWMNARHVTSMGKYRIVSTSPLSASRTDSGIAFRHDGTV